MLPFQFIKLKSPIAEATTDFMIRDSANADKHCMAGFEAFWRMSRKAQEEIQKQNGISINEKVVQFANPWKAFIKVRHEVLERDDCNEILSYRRGCANY